MIEVPLVVWFCVMIWLLSSSFQYVVDAVVSWELHKPVIEVPSEIVKEDFGDDGNRE